jgi:hypothetical protein
MSAGSQPPDWFFSPKEWAKSSKDDPRMNRRTVFSAILLIAEALMLVMITGCGLSTGGSQSNPPGSTPPQPDTYTACRYIVPPPTPAPGYLVDNYASDFVQCPAPLGSGLVFTEIVFLRFDNKPGPLEICKDDPIPAGWHQSAAGVSLTQCPPEPTENPAPIGPQTIFIARNP